MKKNILVPLLAVMLVFLSASNAFATRQVLSVPAVEQEGTWWCWAACDEAITLFLNGSSPSQQYMTENYSDFDSGAGSIDTAQECLSGACSLSSSYAYNALSYNNVQSQINAGSPIFVSLIQGGWGGHANVIRGYDTSTSFVLFMDPNDGNYHGQKYSKYCNGTHWDGNDYTWDRSLYNIN